jgi:hypothetical protein
MACSGADRSRTGGGDEGPRADLRDAEVRELNLVVFEEDEVVRLDVAMDDSMLMRMGERFEHLLGEVEGQRQRDATAEAVAQSALAHGICQDELAVDLVGVLEGKDVRVMQAGADSDLATEDLETILGQEMTVGELECDIDAFDRVVGTIDSRETAFGDASLNPILAQPATRLERHQSSPVGAVFAGGF